MTQRIVHVAIYDDWADWEPGHLMARVQNPLWQKTPGGLAIRTVGATTAPVRSMGGLNVVPDLTADEVTPEASALLVLPGSASWEGAGIRWAAVLARRFIDAGTPVAAICGATFGLARAGLLDDRQHTSAAAEYLAMSGYAGGAWYVDAGAVTDRAVITAGPVDGLPFARAALELLDVFEPEILDAWYRVFTEHDASAFAVLAKKGQQQRESGELQPASS